MIQQSQILLLLCLHLIVIPLLALTGEDSQAVAPIARRGCQDTCGNVSIPFPFGIGAADCFLDKWFEIECKAAADSNKSAKPFLSKYGIELMEVKLYDRSIATGNLVVGMPPLNMCTSDSQPSRINLTGSPYNFSTAENIFIMEGCAGSAVLVNQSNTIMAGCGTVCRTNTSVIAKNTCYGVECCQTPLSSDTYSYYSPLQSFRVRLDQPNFNNCLVASLIKSDSVNQYIGKMLTSDSTTVPVVLLWSWISNTMPDENHGTCSRSERSKIVYCSCDEGENYYGNPYVSDGCQVPHDCKGCHGYCYPDDRHPNSYACRATPRFTLAAILGTSIGLGVVLLAIGCYGLYRFLKRRREMKRRSKFFKRNGGLLLQQQLSSNEGVVERTKIFTTGELEKATDNFHENRILGQGGQGTVYKGMLSDGRIVAIKKSKLLDESQLEQFINEVVILSQINHRHVVKLLGCCLETEIPLLVYEFVPSGTLSQHIHDPDEDLFIDWAMRLKVAIDSAGAIAYLHSSSSIPIYHRDIKSSNILLDDKNRAKVSDFGSSKTIAIDQTHLTTLVQGTMGYLDPEYFQSYQFTEKSDVYSFGVVLLELLTGKKPIYRAENMEQKNLAAEFLFMMENSRLDDVLDPEIVKEAKEEELMAVAELAMRCLSWKGKMRPTMKEVAMTLEMIIRSPAEMSGQDRQVFPDEGFSGILMAETSEIEFMSSPVVGGAGSPMYIDVHPLLRDTI